MAESNQEFHLVNTLMCMSGTHTLIVVPKILKILPCFTPTFGVSVRERIVRFSCLRNLR